MFKKLMFLGAGAVGYVLGAKAGRERYEQIAAQARKLRSNPAVQAKVGEAKSAAMDAATTAKDAAAEKMRRHPGDDQPAGVSPSATSTPTGATGPGA
jgi:hypothetical protein